MKGAWGEVMIKYNVASKAGGQGRKCTSGEDEGNFNKAWT